MFQNPRLRAAAVIAMALAASACAANPFTGPIEVTRFAAPQTTNLGKGTIALRFARELENEDAADAFRGAISDELALRGYTIIANESIADQIATVDTARNAQAAANEDGSPVSVGVGGGTGGFGTGLGVGVGFNLGSARDRSPRVVSELSVAIMENTGAPSRQNLWEARAQFPTSVDSPYAPVAVNARALAAAIFKDFPQGNGETISLNASELVEP